MKKDDSKEKILAHIKKAREQKKVIYVTSSDRFKKGLLHREKEQQHNLK